MAKSKSKAVAKPYEPTPLEKQAVDSYQSRERKNAPLPAFVAKTSDGSVRLDLDHPDLMTGYTLVAEAIKSNSLDYFTGSYGRNWVTRPIRRRGGPTSASQRHRR